jgi:hypothetical protein
MSSKTTLWQRIGLHEWFLKKEASIPKIPTPILTPDSIYDYILEKFGESITQLSFANRIVFYHEYIICFNPQDYEDFTHNKKGIFGLIIQECIKKFYDILRAHRDSGKTVEPASNKWVFRFVSHPDYPRGDKSFIGKLLPGNMTQQKEQNLRVTYIPRQTGIAETFDINNEILQAFTFYSEGYYEIPYQESFVLDESKIRNATPAALARFETIVPDKGFNGKKIEYLMKDESITVSGIDETDEASSCFKIPSDWVNSPHLQIRYNKGEQKFYLASYGEKTMLNEMEVAPSDPRNPDWTELPLNSRIVLNGIVGVNIFKS